MSLMRLFERIFDPVTERKRETEERRKREPGNPDDAGEPEIELGPAPTSARPAAEYVCRVCQRRGDQPLFCPDCLAETMRPA